MLVVTKAREKMAGIYLDRHDIQGEPGDEAANQGPRS